MAGLPGQRDESNLQGIFDHLQSLGHKSNEPKTVALAILWLASQGGAVNGTALSIMGDEIIDLESLLYNTRPEYVSKEYQILFANKQF